MRKKITILLAFVVFAAIPAITIAAPSCSTTPNGVPENIGDPACYESRDDCEWEKIQDMCKMSMRDLGDGGGDCNSEKYIGVSVGYNCSKYSARRSCKDSSGTKYYKWSPWAGYPYYIYENTCDTSQIWCNNASAPALNKPEVCYYLTVSEWSECNLETGIQTATSVKQNSVEGTDCRNLDELTTRFCPACGTGECTSLTEAPILNLCTIGTESTPVLVDNEWTWTCTENDMTTDTCNAPCNQDGVCNSDATGEYVWNATEFRGDLCSGGTPTISLTSFDTVLPMPATSGTPTTVTWGCDHIGVGVSTDSNACNAFRNTPKPGICGPDNEGSFDVKGDIIDLCCNPDNNPPCVVDNDFSSAISQSGKVWNWTCGGSKGIEIDVDNCEAICIPEIDVDVSPNPFPLTSDGITVKVTVSQTGVCTGEYTCMVNGQLPDGSGQVTFDNITSAMDVIVACGGTEVYNQHVVGYCTAKSCNAQGTCQSTPIVSNSLDDNKCNSTCNSNADCASGRIIETRP